MVIPLGYGAVLNDDCVRYADDVLIHRTVVTDSECCDRRCYGYTDIVVYPVQQSGSQSGYPGGVREHRARNLVCKFSSNPVNLPQEIILPLFFYSIASYIILEVLEMAIPRKKINGMFYHHASFDFTPERAVASRDSYRKLGHLAEILPEVRENPVPPFNVQMGYGVYRRRSRKEL